MQRLISQKLQMRLSDLFTTRALLSTVPVPPIIACMCGPLHLLAPYKTMHTEMIVFVKQDRVILNYRRLMLYPPPGSMWEQAGSEVIEPSYGHNSHYYDVQTGELLSDSDDELSSNPFTKSQELAIEENERKWK